MSRVWICNVSLISHLAVEFAVYDVDLLFFPCLLCLSVVFRHRATEGAGDWWRGLHVGRICGCNQSQSTPVVRGNSNVSLYSNSAYKNRLNKCGFCVCRPRASAAAERLWSNEEKTSSVDQAFPRLENFRCKLVR